MFADPEFREDIKYTPEQLWTLQLKEERVYWDASSGDWWWNKQVSWIGKMNNNEMNLQFGRRRWQDRGSVTLRLQG